MDTCDLNLAAAILTVDTMSRLDREWIDLTDRRHIRVRIISDRAKEIEEKWYGRNLEGDLFRFSTFMKDLKSYIYAKQQV